MLPEMLHIYRNNPFGRENLLQSNYFCHRVGQLTLSVFVPTHPRFNMTFGNTDEVVVFLNASYLEHRDTAEDRVREILAGSDVRYHFHEVERLAGEGLPEVSTRFRFMTCPRVVSDQIGRIGLGHIGPKVRAIVKNARFAVLIPSLSFKPWDSVSIFFGGSSLGAKAVRLGLSIANQAKVPFKVYTQLKPTTRQQCERTLLQEGLMEAVHDHWVIFEDGSLGQNLFAVPHDSLVVVGAAGERLIRELVFGSNLEKIQMILPNPLLVLGPRWTRSDR